MLQVFGAFFLLLPDNFGAFFLDKLHFCLECFLVVIGPNLILFRVAAILKIGFLLLFALGYVQAVERRLQVFYLIFVGIFLVVGYLPDAF